MRWRATAVVGVATVCGCGFEVIQTRLVATDALVEVVTMDDVAVDAAVPDAAGDAARGDGPRPDASPDASRPDAIADVSVADASFVGQRSCSPPVAGCGQARIGGGTFSMGDPMAFDRYGLGEGAAPRQDHITVGGFMLDRYEVTVVRFNAFWRARMVDGGASIRRRPISYPGGRTISWDGVGQAPLTMDRYCNWTMSGARDGHPITCVDWWTGQEFCAWDTDGGRLPTEAEWEYAARGPLNRPWPWGALGSTTPDSRVCWMRSTGTCLEEDPVFASGATPDGVRHLVGNVWEWTADSYASYVDTTCWNNQARSDPLCMNDSDSRSVRGGSWGNIGAGVRSGARDVLQPSRPYETVGFRCAGTMR